MKYSTHLQKAFIVACIVLFSFEYGCVKENFVEPVDPFEQQKLEPDAQVITLGSGANALKLKTNQANIIQTEYGIKIKGSLYMVNSKYGDMALTSGDFDLIKDTSSLHKGSSDEYYSDLDGFALIDIPKVGLLKNFEMLGLTATSFGYKKGSEFETGAFEWPVNQNRYYFYYENDDNPMNALLENASFFKIKKIAIDPTDPFVFFTCDFGGTKIGELQDIGFGVSVQGYLSFEPAVSIGGIKGFYGNLYLCGTIPIEKYQVSITGEGCVGFNSGDPEGIKKFFSGRQNDFNLGINGKLSLYNEILDFLNMDIVLGQATIILAFQETGDVEFKFAGLREIPSSTVSDFLRDVIGKDYNFLDYLIPLEQKEYFYGTVGTDISDWMLGFKMESSLNLPGNIHIEMGKTQLEVSSSHMYFYGQAGVACFGQIGVEGYVNKSGDFKLTGFAKKEFDASYKSLSIGYSLGLSVSVALQDEVFTFKGEFHLKGKACLGKLCASISVKGSVEISTDGTFEVCFSIGIGKIGYDVCIDFDKDLNSSTGYSQTMTAVEIPLEQVPLENRFPAEECE